jgi:hypothetical protein
MIAGLRNFGLFPALFILSEDVGIPEPTQPPDIALDPILEFGVGIFAKW